MDNPKVSKAQDKQGKVVYTLHYPNNPVPTILYPPGSRSFKWDGAEVFVERDGRYVPVKSVR